MYTTYHLASALEVNADLLDAIKATFKAKPITIIVEEDADNYELTAEMKKELDRRMTDDVSTFITEEESIKMLKTKYAL